MQITGEMIIGRQLVRGAAGTLLAFNPATRKTCSRRSARPT